MADFATRLRELRNSRGLRQKDLAQELGLAQTTIANYEQKNRFPDERILGRIADYFDVSLDYLLGRAEASMQPWQAVKQEEEGQQPPSSPLSGLALRYLEELLGGRREQAGKAVRQAYESGKSLREIYQEVFEPSLKELGRLWAEGKVDVAREHFFSESTLTFMSQLLARAEPGAKRSKGRSCLCLSVCRESHLIGVRMVADLLELDGWNSQFLGGDVCTQHILRALAETHVELLAVSVTLPEHLGYAAELIRALRSSIPVQKVKVLVGGQAFHRDRNLWRAIGGDGTAADAAEAVRAANRLLESGRA
jgi:methanogenic corrinoid protein MtbC1/DNA-binding Xre family transcriptional regulator